jgi:hypothetical protein
MYGLMSNSSSRETDKRVLWMGLWWMGRVKAWMDPIHTKNKNDIRCPWDDDIILLCVILSDYLNDYLLGRKNSLSLLDVRYVTEPFQVMGVSKLCFAAGSKSANAKKNRYFSLTRTVDFGDPKELGWSRPRHSYALTWTQD